MSTNDDKSLDDKVWDNKAWLDDRSWLFAVILVAIMFAAGVHHALSGYGTPPAAKGAPDVTTPRT